MMNNKNIRVLALVIIRKGDQLLVSPKHDNITNEDFHRLPGGGVEFGETSLDAIKREMKEEFDAELINIKLEKVIENIFILNGLGGHEICFIYSAGFADPSLYDQTEFKIVDTVNGTAIWKNPNTIDRLYPQGAL